MSSEVALEDAGRFAGCFAFGDAARDVGTSRGVVLAAVKDDGVQGAVELAVAAAAEPVPDRLTAGGGKLCDAGEASERGLRAEPIAM